MHDQLHRLARDRGWASGFEAAASVLHRTAAQVQNRGMSRADRAAVLAALTKGHAPCA